MRKTRDKTQIIVLVVGCVVFVTLQVANALQTAEEQRQWGLKRYAKIPKLTGTQAYFLFQQGKLVIVDAGPPNRFKTQHCVGAINIPEQFADKLANKLKLKIPSNALIAVY